MNKELIFQKINQVKQEAMHKNSKFTKKDVLYMSLLALFGVLLIAGIFVLIAAFATGHYRSSISTFVCVPFTAVLITGILYSVYRYNYNKINKSFNILLNPNNNQLELLKTINFIVKKDKNFFGELTPNQVAQILLS